MKKYVFSHSQLAAAECSNKYHIRYTLKLKTKRYSKIRALKIGKLFHAGIEMLYKAARQDIDFDALFDGTLIKKATDHVHALGRQMRDEVEADEHEPDALFKRKLDIDFEIPVIMLKAYYYHIFMKETYEIVEPEQEVKVNVRTPSGRKSPNMFYMGIIDSIIRNVAGDNELYMQEIKTAANWSDKNDHFLAIDNQTTGYHWMAREMGLPITGTIYTICLKPGSKPNLTKEAKARKALAKKEGRDYTYDPVGDYETAEEYLRRIEKDYMENSGRYFIRKIFTRSKEQLDRFQVELYYKCQDAKRVRESHNFMQPSMMKCPGCEGYDLCQSWTEETMKRWYIRKGYAIDDTIEEIILD